jgi:hypothetical protein
VILSSLKIKAILWGYFFELMRKPSATNITGLFKFGITEEDSRRIIEKFREGRCEKQEGRDRR